MHRPEHRRCRMCVYTHSTCFLAGGVRFFVFILEEITMDAESGRKYLGFDQRPRALDCDSKYKDISVAAKELYTKLLSRSSLSSKAESKYRDDYGVYVIYTVKEACNSLNCGRDKAMAAFGELVEVGLIQRRRVGYSNPYRIYVTDILHRSDKPTSTQSDHSTYIDRAGRPVEVGNTAPIKTNTQINNNIYTDTLNGESEQIIQAVQQLFDAYPLHRRQTISNIMRVVNDLSLTTDDLQLAQRNLAYYVESAMWHTSGGRYVPSVTKWLCEGLWRIRPKGPRADGRRELDDDEIAAIQRMMSD